MINKQYSISYISTLWVVRKSFFFAKSTHDNDLISQTQQKMFFNTQCSNMYFYICMGGTVYKQRNIETEN